MTVLVSLVPGVWVVGSLVRSIFYPVWGARVKKVIHGWGRQPIQLVTRD